MADTLKGGTWNMRVGRNGDHVRTWLTRLLRAHRLDFLLLQEAITYIDDLRKIEGYTVFVFPGHLKEQRESVVLVRDGLPTSEAKRHLLSDHGWAGKHEEKQGRYGVSVLLDGWLRVLSLHEPPSVSFETGKPVGPSNRAASFVEVSEALVDLGRTEFAEDEALLYGGDWNESARTSGYGSPGWVAESLGMETHPTDHATGIHGGRIDWCMSRGCAVRHVRVVPDNGGGDHFPVLWEVRRTHAEPAPAEPSTPEQNNTEEEGSMVEIADFIEAPNSGGDYDKNLLVVHVTISPEVKDAARGVIRFWQRGRTGSTQYVVDNREIIQAVRETAYAWAAGTHANKCGIHVELCGFIQTVRQWRDGYSTAELDLAARLFAELATKYGIPIRKIGPAQIRKAYETGKPEDGGICGHVDITHTWPADTSHTDPGTYFPWARFLDLVRKYADNPRADAPAEHKDWFDMATQNDLQDAIRNTRITVRSGKDDEKKEWRLETLLSHLEQEQDQTQQILRELRDRDADALAEKVAAKVNANVIADAEVVKQAVKDALAEGTGA